MAIQIHKYVVLGTERILIYGGILAAMVAANVAIAVHGPIIPGLPIGLTVLAATAFICYQLLAARLAGKAAIKYYTSQGVAVIPGLLTTPDYSAITVDVATVMEWWSAKFSASAAAITDAFNGASLKIVVSDTPLQDLTYNISARGLTDGNQSTVLWEPKNNGQDFREICKHEFSHICLSAMGVPVEDQHARMAAEGCPWK